MQHIQGGFLRYFGNKNNGYISCFYASFINLQQPYPYCNKYYRTFLPMAAYWN